MNIDITEEYFKIKKNNIHNYSVLLSKIFDISSKKIWNTERNINISTNKILSQYIIDYYLKEEYPTFDDEEQNNLLNLITKYPIVKEFNKLKVKYSIFEIICFVFDYFKIKDLNRYSTDDINELIYISLVIWISIIIDYYSCSLLTESLNPKEFIKKIIGIGTKDNFIKVTADDSLIDELIHLGLTNYKNDIAFFEKIKSKNSFNTYQLTSKKDTYYVSYNYEIPVFENFSENDIVKVYNKLNMNLKTFPLLLRHLNVTLLKVILLKIPIKKFYIPYIKKYWTNKNNVKNYIKMFNSNYLREKILILFDSTNSDSEITKLFKEQGIYFAKEKKDFINKEVNLSEDELIKNRM